LSLRIEGRGISTRRIGESILVAFTLMTPQRLSIADFSLRPVLLVGAGEQTCAADVGQAFYGGLRNAQSAMRSRTEHVQEKT
jgi:hypothetical protein